MHVVRPALWFPLNGRIRLDFLIKVKIPAACCGRSKYRRRHLPAAFDVLRRKYRSLILKSYCIDLFRRRIGFAAGIAARFFILVVISGFSLLRRLIGISGTVITGIAAAGTSATCISIVRGTCRRCPVFSGIFVVCRFTIFSGIRFLRTAALTLAGLFLVPAGRQLLLINVVPAFLLQSLVLLSLCILHGSFRDVRLTLRI